MSPSTQILPCVGVWISTLHCQHMVGHDNLAAAHTPSAATLCWQGLGMAKRCPVNSGSIIWTSGLRVSPHCRHARGPSLIIHHASLPCKGERHACDSISSKPCAAHQRNHACGAPLLCMSHCVAKVLHFLNLAFLFEGRQSNYPTVWLAQESWICIFAT